MCDPACGGGAFLVAAAERLHRAGVDRRDVVRHHVWGADVDPVGLAAAEAALALWAGEAPPPGRLVVGDPLRRGGRAVAGGARRGVRGRGRQPAVPEPARPPHRPVRRRPRPPAGSATGPPLRAYTDTGVAVPAAGVRAGPTGRAGRARAAPVARRRPGRGCGARRRRRAGPAGRPVGRRRPRLRRRGAGVRARAGAPRRAGGRDRRPRPVGRHLGPHAGPARSPRPARAGAGGAGHRHRRLPGRVLRPGRRGARAGAGRRRHRPARDQRDPAVGP